jgi:hypothetical protein
LIIKDTSLKPVVAYEPTKRINIKGISNSLMKTEGTVTLGLLTETHETKHSFQLRGTILNVCIIGFKVEFSGKVRRPPLTIVTAQLSWAK